MSENDAGPPADLNEIDRALLIAIAHPQGEHAPLSSDQERLLDEWVAGQLAPADADRAAALASRNSFAAERALERRLIEAANVGPEVPAALTARVLKLKRETG